VSPSTRRGLIAAAATASLAGLALVPRKALGAHALAPAVRAVSTKNVGRRYAGDRELFATVAPGVPGRDTAAVRFTLTRPARVKLEAVRAALRRTSITWETEAMLAAGDHELTWSPAPSTSVGSYVMRLTVERPDGTTRKVLGGQRPASIARQRAAVVRVLGVEAAFGRRSYIAGEPMELRIFADAPAMTLQFLRSGPEPESTERSDEIKGVPMGDPVRIDWTGKRSAPVTIHVQTGDWPTGFYAARLTTDDGRVGFAPFVLRPRTLGTVRQAVILPTNTWQAYNFYDDDGDGWGDTWYAGGNPPVRLDRPYRDRGVPPRFKRYDLAFLKWLHRTARQPEMLADDDLEAIASGDELRALYDLVVFPGHSEYMTEHAYDVVERFRDLGGRLIFLSANNFFWKVEKQDNTMRRVKLWRQLGRPEARLCGVQYRANDDGSRQAPFDVIAAEAAPWLFDGTGLQNGSKLGETVGGYGIEIDGTTPDSPPGTQVVALIANLFGPGLHAEMAVYETPAAARVFSAGVLDFASSAASWPVRRILENLWQHMLEDIPPLPPALAVPPVSADLPAPGT
jgi:hypothetical protein